VVAAASSVRDAGEHSAPVPGAAHLAPGLYFVGVEVPGASGVRRMIMVR